jgi:Tol biopolymer transport system component
VRLVVAVGLLIALVVAATIGFGSTRRALPHDGLITLEVDGDLWVVSPDGMDLKPLSSGPSVTYSPAWSPRGDSLAYLEAEADSIDIVLFDVTTGRSRRLTLPDPLAVADGATIEGWSPDGRFLVLPAADDAGLVSVAIIDVADGTVVRVGDPPSYAFGFSPDGRWLGLKSVRGPVADIVVVRADGTEPRTLVANGRVLDMPGFTPDGSAVVFHQQSGPSTYDGDISSVDILTGKVRKLVSGPTNDVEPRISPDGRRVAFSRSPTLNITAALDHLDGSIAPAELYVADLDSGEPRRLASGIWPGALWSPDGSRLAAVTHDLGRLLIVSADGASPVIRVDLPPGVGTMTWQPLGP